MDFDWQVGSGARDFYSCSQFPSLRVSSPITEAVVSFTCKVRRSTVLHHHCANDVVIANVRNCLYRLRAASCWGPSRSVVVVHRSKVVSRIIGSGKAIL